MRSLVIGLLVVLGFVACGGKAAEKADKAAVETYINTDLNPIIGMLWVGKKPLDTVKQNHYDDAKGWFAHPSGLDEIVIPRMEQVLAGLAKVTPPPTMTAIHQQLVEVATTYRDVSKDFGDAVAADDKAKFEATYAKLSDGRAKYERWKQAMDATLTDYGITLKDPPVPAPLPK